MGDLIFTATLANIIIVYAMVVISPGPNFLFVSRLALRNERAAAFTSTFGIAVGATVNASLTMFGLGALLVVAPGFKIAILAAGGFVLLYLGASALWSGIREWRAGGVGSGVAENFGPAGPTGYANAFQQGFLLNLTNPKGISFFMGLYATLIVGAPLALKIAVLVICFAIEIFWYGAVILALGRAPARRAAARFGVVLDLVVGACLMLLSGRVLTEVVAEIRAAPLSSRASA